MHILTLRIKVPQSRRKDLLDAVKMVAGPTQVQAECVSYRIYQDMDDPNAVFLVGEWKSRLALDTHLLSKEFRIILSLIELSTVPPEFRIMTISKAEGLEALEKLSIQP